MSYAQISARLGIPVDSIGPARGRCLDKLRRYPAIEALINAGESAADHETDGQAAAQLRRSANGPRPAMPFHWGAFAAGFGHARIAWPGAGCGACR